MSDTQGISLIFGGALVLLVAILVLISRNSSTLQKRLLSLATSFGWEEPRRIWWWNGSMRGRWRGMKVQMQHMGRYKGTPERLLLTLTTASPARVKIKRRTSGFLSKPITLFGPPLVEPMNADRERYWIRSDELVFAERLFSHAAVAPALEPNLIAGFDVVDLQPKQLRILRAIDDRAVKKHFNRPFLGLSRDYELIETIATEEWRLATVIIESLGLRGYEMA